MTSSRPESRRRKAQCTEYKYQDDYAHSSVTKSQRGLTAALFELANKFMSIVLCKPEVTSVTVEANIKPHNSIKPIKHSPLRRGHNVQFSSEMTLAGVKTHQRHRKWAGTDKWPVSCVLCLLRFGLVTSIQTMPSPARRGRLQIAARRGGEQHTWPLVGDLNEYNASSNIRQTRRKINVQHCLWNI